jgi:hypothetical protein
MKLEEWLRGADEQLSVPGLDELDAFGRFRRRRVRRTAVAEGFGALATAIALTLVGVRTWPAWASISGRLAQPVRWRTRQRPGVAGHWSCSVAATSTSPSLGR